MSTSAELHLPSSDLRDPRDDSPERDPSTVSPSPAGDGRTGADAADDRHPLLRFFDAFLQEQNIKWILAAGMAILFGSSAMLVAADWESFPPLGKFITLLAYTAAIFGAGELSYHRLGLRRTGTFLWALVVLLLPIDLLALRWLPAMEISDAMVRPFLLAAWLVAGGAGFAFAVVAARRIFGHFLRGSQPTFLAAYLLLCLAGALPELPAGWAMPATLWPLAYGVVLWAVFTAGTVKVSRHVFWLAEERRWPRIWGFAPVALLGAQFVTLFVLHVAPRLTTEWLGLACALSAVPILLTADAVLGVYTQRTGGLLRPLPASIVLPFFLGLALCGAGLWLAATGWPRPYALVPTAALTALALGVAASRTGHPAFVWCMLAAALVAYRFCPLYFEEAARFVVEHSAAALKESRLPLAFYGLSCLPFIAAVTAINRWLERRGDAVYARPMRHFAVAVAVLLMLVAFTHAKAVFPVGAVMTALFAAQACVFRDTRLLWPAAVSLVATGFGFAPFAERVLEWNLPADARFLGMATAAALLFWPGRRVERAIAARSEAERDVRRARSQAGAWERVFGPCRTMSLAVVLLLAIVWPMWFLGADTTAVPWCSGLLLAGLLATHTLARPVPALGQATLIFGLTAGLLVAGKLGATFSTLVSGATVALAVLWLGALVLRKVPERRVSQAFAEPAYRVSLVGLTGLLAWHAAALAVASFPGGSLGTRVFGADSPVAWLCGLLTVAWGFDAARRLPHALHAWLACAGVLSLVSSALALTMGSGAMVWYPAAWAATAVVAVPIASRLNQRIDFWRAQRLDEAALLWTTRSLRCVAGPMNLLALLVLLATAFATLAGFAVELRIAGAIAVAGLLYAASDRRDPVLTQLAIITAAWQVLALLVKWCVPDAVHVFSLTHAQLHAAAIPLAAAAAVGLAVTGALLRRIEGRAEDLVVLHRLSLWAAVAGSLLVLLTAVQTLPASGLLVPLEIFGITLTFAALVADELWTACRSRNEERVWLAEGLAVVGLAYLAVFGVISFGQGTTMFAVLGAALVMSAAAALVSHQPGTLVMERPFRRTAIALPLVTVSLGVLRHLTHADPQWLGLGSLALLLAAGFYFWLGLEQRRKRYIVLAVGVLNVSLAMLWRELAWSDPQFYMVPLGVSILGLVELLKPNLPRELWNPLRHAGALVILVSPTFHIVEGSWVHLLTLMLASLAVLLTGIGLRIRALAYLGTGFLAADLVAMVVRGSVDHPNLLWITGLAVGAAVIVLAAFCENHRETLLARLRVLATELERWE